MQLSPDNRTLLKVTNKDININGIFQVPEGVTSIGNFAFENCTVLQTLIFHNAIRSIEHNAFFGCHGLKELVLTKGVKSIENYAFADCSNLKWIMLPEGLTSIGYEVFLNCLKLNLIVIASDNEAEVMRITKLLPELCKSKVINRCMFDEIIRCRDKQLARLIQVPQTNQLYRFFNYDTRASSKVYVEIAKNQLIEKDYSLLPEEIFCCINEQLDKDNPYYRRAKTLIGYELWPKNKSELEIYKVRVTEIVNFCINQAIKWNQVELGKIYENSSAQAAFS
ncbi:leucine-rich repeat domain-containing protein [Legionella gresilensis]|uniref:leucine-rich repeat domain-containing protein n=1 Tax=Legionella gresilensis TaxID=91823 RepID=UPI0010411CC0|nr:leucine-rich repeat domain-containing protein [Legionella gresilensis]